HRAHRPGQAENLQRHGRSGSRHERTGQPARLDLPPIDGSAKACLGTAGEKIPGGGEEGQRNAGHGKADPGFRSRLILLFHRRDTEYGEKRKSLTARGTSAVRIKARLQAYRKCRVMNVPSGAEDGKRSFTAGS